MAFQSMATQAARVWDNSQGQWQEIVDAGYDPYAADVWSYAVVVFTLVTGSKPFHASCIADNVFRAFLHATQPGVVHDELCAPWCDRWLEDCLPGSSGKPKPNLEKWEWPEEMSTELVDLLGRCLRLRSGERISMAQVLEHPWLTSPLARDVHNKTESVLANVPVPGTFKVLDRQGGASSASASGASSTTPSSPSVQSIRRDPHSSVHLETARSPAHATFEQQVLSPQAINMNVLQPIQQRSSNSDEVEIAACDAAAATSEVVNTLAQAAAESRIVDIKLQQDADDMVAQLREAGHLYAADAQPDLIAPMCTPTVGTTASLSMARSNSSAANLQSPKGTAATGGSSTVWKFSFATPGGEGGSGSPSGGGGRMNLPPGSVTRPNRRFSGSQKRIEERSFVGGFEHPQMPSALRSPHGAVTSPLVASSTACGGESKAKRFTFSKAGCSSGGDSPVVVGAAVHVQTAHPCGAESCASSDVAGEAGDTLAPLVAKVRLPAVARRGAVVSSPIVSAKQSLDASKARGRMRGPMSRSGSSSSANGQAPPFQMRASSSLDPSNSGAMTPKFTSVASSGCGSTGV